MSTSARFDRTHASRHRAISRIIAATALVAMAVTSTIPAAMAAEESPQASVDAVSGGEPRFWSDVLAVGDCIIRPEEGVLPDPIPCDELHGEEIYAIGRLDLGPDAPYPGDAISDMVGESLCDEATVGFGGETWDLLPFTTYWLYPLESEWAAGDRGIMCSAGPPEGIDLKIGTAAGGGLDSDDVLLARGGFTTPDLGEASDWVAVEEHSTISTIGTFTDTRFDIPRRRAWVVPQGFMFDATERGDPSPVTTTWGFTWETGDLTDLGSILPGWELSSSMVRNGVSVFAAREEPDDDWDLFASTTEAGTVVIAGGPGNQQYPTFTPDGGQVVFHDDGKLAIVNVDGSDARLLVDRDSTAYESEVSPDGTLVAFASDHDGNDDIWLVSIDGGEPVNLTAHPANEAWPTWSADGSRIYFNTDRLRPENQVSSLMMMNADGSDASWFSGASVGQALVLDRAIVDDVIDTLLTIDDRYVYEPIEGEPGSTATWEHGSGLLSADLPVGWRVAPFDAGVGFIAAPRPSRYYDAWEADGVAVTRYDDRSSEEFFALVDETVAVGSCERVDGADGTEPLTETIDMLALTFACGEQGATASVTALYDNGTGVAVLIEGQRDGAPDADADIAVLHAIIESLDWD